jgi:alpha-beta hydrolase superfamily lysophospholipase
MPKVQSLARADLLDRRGISIRPRSRVTVLAPILALLALPGCEQAATLATPTEQPSAQPAAMAITDVTFLADDGLTVSGRFYRAAQPKAVILLFHQADSSLAEYATIAPRLVEQGFSVLAIDQRSGGSMFGTNLTASRRGGAPTYNDALHDLEAALVWSRQTHLPIIVWGSSYSAALVFKLAARHPTEVSALLAFSPGEYLGPGRPVSTAAAELKIPVYISVGSSPEELANAKPIFAATASRDKVLNVPEVGIHGSSTLIASRNSKGAEANWGAVNRFLASVASRTVQRPPMID